MSYDKTIAHLKKGPRLKSDATKDLEKIVHLFLSPTQNAQCRFNSRGELEVAFQDHVFNLTQILLHQPDFEHFSFSEQVSAHYEKFIKTANHTPSLAGNPTIPKKEDYEAADKNKVYAQLTYGEKLAITLYTSNFYEEINAFLRSQGRDPRFKTLQPDQLTALVKEIILASCLAAQGVTRLELPDDSDNNSPQEVYRAESSHKIPQTVWQQRYQAMATQTPIRQEGFISTSDEMKAMKVGGTDTTIKISQPRNAIGKRVQDLSYKADEQEILLVPGTQLAFGSFTQEHGRNVFDAFVVRSLDGIDPNSYSTLNSETRTQLIAFHEQITHLIPQIPRPAKASFWKLLPQAIKKTETAEFQALANQLNKLIIWFEDSKHTPREKKEKLQTLYKQINKLADRVEDSNLLYPPLKEAATQVNHLIIQLEMGNSSGLIREAEYVYTHHLSNAYKETNLDSTDALLEHDNEIIHRPNHGLTHSLRVATYIPLVVEYFQQFAKPKLSQLCQDLSGSELKKLQLCMLFSVSGRESDIGFRSNPEKYREYRQRCAEQFIQYAQSRMSKSDVKKYAELILNMGNPDYLKSKNITPKKEALFHIMNMAHKLDLMRCYPLAQYNQAVANGHDSLISPSPLQQQHFNSLLKTVSQRIHATGDRQFCQMKDNQLTPCNEDYNFPVFAKASTDPRECLQRIVEADMPVLMGTPSSVKSQTQPSTADEQSHHLTQSVIFLDDFENYSIPLLNFLTAVTTTGLPAIDTLKEDGRYLLQKLIPQEDHFILVAETAYMDTKPINIPLTRADFYSLLSQMPAEILKQRYSVDDLLPLLNQSVGQLHIAELDKMDSSYQITSLKQDQTNGMIRIKATSPQQELAAIEVVLSPSELAERLEALNQASTLKL